MVVGPAEADLLADGPAHENAMDDKPTAAIAAKRETLDMTLPLLRRLVPKSCSIHVRSSTEKLMGKLCTHPAAGFRPSFRAYRGWACLVSRQACRKCASNFWLCPQYFAETPVRRWLMFSGGKKSGSAVTIIRRRAAFELFRPTGHDLSRRCGRRQSTPPTRPGCCEHCSMASDLIRWRIATRPSFP